MLGMLISTKFKCDVGEYLMVKCFLSHVTMLVLAGQ